MLSQPNGVHNAAYLGLVLSRSSEPVSASGPEPSPSHPRLPTRTGVSWDAARNDQRAHMFSTDSFGPAIMGGVDVTQRGGVNGG